MEIRITRNENKPHIIRYIRDNGTDTWMQADEYFVRHDISHYALEKTLGYTTAFNGMLNNGMDIRDFENRALRNRLSITAEAWYAENMANLFLMELAQGVFEDFNAVQQAAFRNFNLDQPLTTLTVEQVTDVRNYLRELLQQWAELPSGETMELSFPT